MKKFKMAIAMVCAIGITFGGSVVNASEKKTENDEYNVYWNEPQKVWVKQDYQSEDEDFIIGTTLGYIRIQTGISVSKDMVVGNYLQKLLINSEVVPLAVTKNKKAMLRYMTMQVANGSFYEYIEDIKIEPMSGSQDEAIIITNIDDNGYVRWDYDYTEKTDNRFENSTQYSGLLWSTREGGLPIYPNFEVKITAAFGGGNITSNQLFNRFKLENYELGSVEVKLPCVMNVGGDL